MIHQVNKATHYNRYPSVFRMCSDMFMGRHQPFIAHERFNVLSFGCSIGDEIQTLKELYFPYSLISGVDINEDCVNKCKERFGYENPIYNYQEFLISETKYDIIFAMSVFCKWEDTENINDCSSIYPFELFDKGIGILADKLVRGGALVIYNANFCMFESSHYGLFTPKSDYSIDSSGFVHKFNKKNIKIDVDYRDVIFIKK